MTQPVRTFPLWKKTDSPEQQERRELLEELTKTRRLIDQAYACFNQESDPDLIESYVFEIKALQSRYSYLLRRVRQMEQEPVLPAAEA